MCCHLWRSLYHDKSTLLEVAVSEKCLEMPQ
jgi:hypothetical protein